MTATEATVRVGCSACGHPGQLSLELRDRLEGNDSLHDAGVNDPIVHTEFVQGGKES